MTADAQLLWLHLEITQTAFGCRDRCGLVRGPSESKLIPLLPCLLQVAVNNVSRASDFQNYIMKFVCYL